MSRPDPDDLDKQLSTDPLNRKGFTESLQQDIEKSIARKEKSRKRLKSLLIFGGSTALIAVISLFSWSALFARNDVALTEKTASYGEPQEIITSPPPINTALLIGLRTDHQSVDPSRAISATSYSTYRTMLVAPVQGELQKTSEGSGILMPYKQKFWKIDSLVYKSATQEVHYLSPRLADQPVKPLSFTETSNEPVQQVETLVFAGNEYLSIVQSEQTLRNKVVVQSEKAWVRTLLQLNEKRTSELSSVLADQPYVSLTNLFGSEITGVLDDLSGKRQIIDLPSEITGRNWMIARTPGRWVAKAAETYLQPINNTEDYLLHELPRALPNKVSNHDTICCAWSDIQSYWPHAKDALTSPMNDLIVIVEDNSLKFYPYGQWPSPAPLMTLSLQPGETLIMAQWATNHYVQEWIDKTAKLLKD